MDAGVVRGEFGVEGKAENQAVTDHHRVSSARAIFRPGEDADVLVHRDDFRGADEGGGIGRRRFASFPRVPAKEVEIDEDGDGKIDGVAKADTQMAVAFFRTEKGNRYGVELIDNPDLRASSLAAFQKGITTLKDVDSKQLANSKDKKANTKSSKKDKKNKK